MYYTRSYFFDIFDIFDDSRRKSVLLKETKSTVMHGFLIWQGGMPISCFLDESAANERTMDRKYGWAPVGVTSHEYKSIKRSERWSILPVYAVEGFYV